MLRGILGLPPGATILGLDALLFFIVVLGLLTGLYTMLGGLLAVVWTESVQTVLLLVGAVTVTAVGYVKVGGWSQLAHMLATNPHPLAAVPGSKINWGTANSFHTLPRQSLLCSCSVCFGPSLPARRPSLPWLPVHCSALRPSPWTGPAPAAGGAFVGPRA